MHCISVDVGFSLLTGDVIWFSKSTDDVVVVAAGVNVFVLPFTSRFSDAELLGIFKKLKQLECLLQVQPGIATLLSQVVFFLFFLLIALKN